MKNFRVSTSHRLLLLFIILFVTPGKPILMLDSTHPKNAAPNPAPSHPESLFARGPQIDNKDRES
jgi:hypothetical protein